MVCVENVHWQPTASMDALRKRAEALATIRAFFNARSYLEVETPIMGRFGVTDVYLANMVVCFRGKSHFLQTSPEYHMKRLLAAGSGPIFQLARVFRDDELGRWHNPEFTMLEWYQLDCNHHELMEEVGVFLQEMLQCQPLIKKTYCQVFKEICGIDPFHAELSELKETVARFFLQGVLPADETNRDQYLFLLMSHVVEPALSKEMAPVAVYDFPVSQAALSQINEGVAERFEVYYRGVELANGFHELSDASLQRARFEEDAFMRQRLGLPTHPTDEYLLAALQQGLPPCSGVALGVDRLLALAWNTPSIAETVSFDFSRA